MKQNSQIKILCTGFVPFADHTVNSSQQLIESINNPQIKTLLLPVSFQNAFLNLEPLLLNQFDYCILFGLAANRSKVSLETLALNRVHCPNRPDNDSCEYTDEIIFKEGPVALASTFPYLDFLNELKKENIESELSHHAGTFVCNYIYYQVLFHCLKNKIKTKCIFIHLPDQAKIEFNLNLINNALKSLLIS